MRVYKEINGNDLLIKILNLYEKFLLEKGYEPTHIEMSRKEWQTLENYLSPMFYVRGDKNKNMIFGMTVVII